MKLKIYVVMATLISLSLNSCKDDVTGADDNITKTPITYTKVLSDQTHKVIMPLKVGNYWIYKITEGDKSEIKYDTLTVVKDTLISGKIWFKLHSKSVYSDIASYTNTDRGFWAICPYHYRSEAPYPVPAESVFLETAEGAPLKLKDTIIKKVYYYLYVDIKNNYQVNLGKFQFTGILYDYRLINKCEVDSIKIPQSLYNHKVFVPDTGLVYQEYFTINDKNEKNVTQIYELIECKINR